VTSEADVRRVALALPETSEKVSWGTPFFRVRNRGFARLREGDVLAIYCASEEDKHALIASAPEKFFTTPHYDGYSMVLVRLAAIDLPELTELITDSWRLRAPSRLLAQFDADHPT
jgi:hypothetical protein